MEQTFLSDFHQSLHKTQLSNSSSLKPFSIANSLILNPSTSIPTLSSILQTLTQTLNQTLPIQFHVIIISLLSRLSITHPNFTSSITTTLNSLLTRPTLSPRATSLALSTLVSLTDKPEILDMSEGVFLSLCFGSSVSVRHKMMLNVEKFGVRPSVLVTVLLGFSKDPFPYVRKAALDGLVWLCKCRRVVDFRLVESCYLRGVELLFDSEECVRCSAVKMVCEWGMLIAEISKDESKKDWLDSLYLQVCEWGKFLVTNSEDKSKRVWSDAVYVQLCLMVRDMSVNVRIEAFKALGRVGMASKYVLMQTLFKRFENKLVEQLKGKHFNLQASSAAGAFVHGLEDEFYEVRSAACNSLRMPAILSAELAARSLGLLMDVLNDDSTIVRLQALETMHHMAAFGHLKVQEVHLHMFLGTLNDMNSSVRSTARKVLRLTKLHDLPMFRLVVDSIIQSLEIYPQDEPDVLSLLFEIGRSHGGFAVNIINEIFLEMDPSSESDWEFNSSKTAARLALAISAPLSHGTRQHLYSIPSTIFSYAVTMLGRISNALNEVMNQETLLAYLSHCSRSTIPNSTLPDSMHDKIVEDDVCTEMDNQITLFHVADQHEVHDEEYSYVKFVLANIVEIWPLLKMGCISEVLMTLRSWKEELATYITDPHQTDSVLTFTLQYIHVVKLLSKAWWHVVLPRDVHNKVGDMGYIMQKLERRLGELRYRFIGLSKEEELHIEELTLVACTMRLSFSDFRLHESALKKLSIYNETSIDTSKFKIEVMSAMQKNDSDTYRFRESLEFFSLKPLILGGNMKYMKAEVDIGVNDWSTPLHFVPGLPVGIRLKIRLHNTPIDTKLWLVMTLSKDLIQYVFIDLKQFEGSDKIREFTFIPPFYRTAKVSSCILRVSIGMECCSEVFCSFRGHGGPNHEIVYLCKEKEVFLSMVVKKS
uniref:protein SIEL n=1 Tax=Erigeron canadensis TaxID=72917 RepID=UPI001CB9796B|nr:protein SIEL [Erigeron canadensis]